MCKQQTSKHGRDQGEKKKLWRQVPQSSQLRKQSRLSFFSSQQVERRWPHSRGTKRKTSGGKRWGENQTNHQGFPQHRLTVNIEGLELEQIKILTKFAASLNSSHSVQWRAKRSFFFGRHLKLASKLTCCYQLSSSQTTRQNQTLVSFRPNNSWSKWGLE